MAHCPLDESSGGRWELCISLHNLLFGLNYVRLCVPTTNYVFRTTSVRCACTRQLPYLSSNWWISKAHHLCCDLVVGRCFGGASFGWIDRQRDTPRDRYRVTTWCLLAGVKKARDNRSPTYFFMDRRNKVLQTPPLPSGEQPQRSPVITLSFTCCSIGAHKHCSTPALRSIHHQVEGRHRTR
jgi:hypothetical protein